MYFRSQRSKKVMGPKKIFFDQHVKAQKGMKYPESQTRIFIKVQATLLTSMIIQLGKRSNSSKFATRCGVVLCEIVPVSSCPPEHPALGLLPFFFFFIGDPSPPPRVAFQVQMRSPLERGDFGKTPPGHFTTPGYS